MKIADQLVEDMQFELVHRMGQKLPDKPRRIVAKFTLFKEREYVRKQWKKLQNTGYFVSEQLTQGRRRKLMPQLREAKAANKRAWLAYDTLYVDGKP